MVTRTDPNPSAGAMAPNMRIFQMDLRGTTPAVRPWRPLVWQFS